jgi:hypothetical protein
MIRAIKITNSPLLPNPSPGFAKRMGRDRYRRQSDRIIYIEILLMKEPQLSLISPQLLLMLTGLTIVVSASSPNFVLYSRHVNYQDIASVNTTKFVRPWLKVYINSNGMNE